MSKSTKYYLETPNHQLMIQAESLLDALRKWGMHVAIKQRVLPLDMTSLRVHYGRREFAIEIPVSRVVQFMRPMVWQMLQLDIYETHGEQALIEFCQRVNREYDLGKIE